MRLGHRLTSTISGAGTATCIETEARAAENGARSGATENAAAPPSPISTSLDMFEAVPRKKMRKVTATFCHTDSDNNLV